MALLKGGLARPILVERPIHWRNLMTTAIFFAIFTLACVLAPIAGSDSRRSGGRGWWPAGPR